MQGWNVVLVVVFGIHAILSKFLFDNIYLTSKLIVDEEFHLPLGEQYCNFNFQNWDPKVTTLPGLYLISSAFLGPPGLCSVYWLRATSLLFSFVNFFLLYISFSSNVQGDWQKVLSALMLTLLPPLYFFSYVYYTDVVSLTTILLLIILNERGYHYWASIAGFLSILCRQSNVIFVAIYGGQYVLTGLYSSWAQKKAESKREGRFPVTNLKPFIKDMLMNPTRTLKNTSLNFWLNSLCYISVLAFFVIFLILNGGIVVGDKSAHQMTVNIPQLFYFSLFCSIFAWPYFGGEVLNFAQFAKRHKALVCLLIFVVFLAIHFNTVTHPYLLADNRHFVFYIWNRFFRAYWWFKYSLIPAYLFALYVILKILWDKNDVSFFLLFTVGVSILLTSQSLLELRYFLIPYIIIRLKIKNVDSGVFNVVLEFVTYSVMNTITLNIFFTRILYWSDMEYPQRIIW